jgi:hypothetical protein
MFDIKGRGNCDLREKREHYQWTGLYSSVRVAYGILTVIQGLRALI